jgi:hypothetical protein
MQLGYVRKHGRLYAVMLKDKWLQDAGCKEYSTDDFFSSQHKRMSPRKAAHALAICAKCTVIDECARDLVEVGNMRDMYPHQIRANRRLWIKEEVESLPLELLDER